MKDAVCPMLPPHKAMKISIQLVICKLWSMNTNCQRTKRLPVLCGCLTDRTASTWKSFFLSILLWYIFIGISTSCLFILLLLLISHYYLYNIFVCISCPFDYSYQLAKYSQTVKASPLFWNKLFSSRDSLANLLLVAETKACSTPTCIFRQLFCLSSLWFGCLYFLMLVCLWCQPFRFRCIFWMIHFELKNSKTEQTVWYAYCMWCMWFWVQSDCVTP